MKREKLEKYNFKKQVLFKIFSQLKQGRLTIYENGQEIASFGDDGEELRADVDILSQNFYSKFLLDGSIGVGESYINGDWQTSDLKKVIQIFARNLSVLDNIEKKMGWLTMPINRLKHFKNRNSLSQSKNNISSHYDLGNTLYKSFLDPSMLYSSAIYNSPEDSLETAQQNKLKAICEKLELKSTDRVVEIGTGWGGLAVYMAKNYGCHVTTTTISEEQYSYTQNLIIENNLSDKITLLKKDYRLLEGRFDKLVSIEMIEAVGQEYLDSFFTKCQDLILPNGMVLIQSITVADQRMDVYKGSVDFIQKHIFPGGFLPSMTMLMEKVTGKTQLAVRDVQDIGLDYAKTLNDWRHAFENNFEEIRPFGYDNKFYRMWKFYFEYCEAGFLERTISTVQILLTNKGHREEINCRK